MYHTMHSRPMPGCLPLFFLLAMVLVGLGLWFAPVEMPQRVKPAGVGKVYVKKDRLTDFVLRRQSPLPLHLPLHADPEYQEDAAAASMALVRPVKILTPPANEIFAHAAASAVLDAGDLLALPPIGGAESAAPAGQEPLPAESSEPGAALHPFADEPRPVFHPGVENATDGEEVQP